MRICLINPYIDISDDIYREDFTMLPPLGLGYLAAVLIESGHKVEIVDCIGAYPLPSENLGEGIIRLGIGNKGIMERVEAFGPEIIGVGCSFTIHAPQSYEIAELVKQEYSPDVPVILGGAHVSVVPEEALAKPYIDYVALGEGESTLRDLCDRIESGAPAEGIPGLLLSDGSDGVKGNPVRPRFTDLDNIPFPRRDLFPLEKYLERQRLFPGDINNRRIPKTTLITSRGCPGNCVFCAIRCTWGRKWIGRSPENVVAEIEFLAKRYGIRELDFVDDNISVSKQRLLRICELLIERGIDITWTTPNGIAIWTLDRETLRVMKRSGCYRLTFGFESGDPDTIEFIRKKYSRDHAKEIVRYSNRIGIWTVGTFIIGFPYETPAQIQNTIDFACDLGLDLAMFYYATPYPGTDMYEVCKKEGIDTTLTPKTRGFATVCLTADEVERYRAMSTVQFMRSLMRRPWKPLLKIRSLEDLRFTSRVVKHGLEMATGRSEEEKLDKYPNFRR